MSANGTTRWSYVVPRRLPKGRHKLWARGIDSAGNVERKLNRRNLGRLTVR